MDFYFGEFLENLALEELSFPLMNWFPSYNVSHVTTYDFIFTLASRKLKSQTSYLIITTIQAL